MAELFKNLYNHEYVNKLSNYIVEVYPEFNNTDFHEDIFDEYWGDRELKERMRHIAITLGKHIKLSYPQTIEILKNPSSKLTPNFGLQNMIFQDFVEVYGRDDIDTSLEALEFFTQTSSSEFAIRVFILDNQNLVMEKMREWAQSESEHSRRLASEGCRPRLPWAIALDEFKKEPSEVVKILEILKDDESEYVRKSVANNLNDISKDNPDITLTLAKAWIGHSQERDRLIKHGCRTLLKASHKEALALFGYVGVEDIELSDFDYTKEVASGGELEFSFRLHSQKALGLLRVEYAIDFVRQKGKSSKKVFKISEGEVKTQEKKIVKSYSFRPITTRKYYSGKHRLSIIIKGKILLTREFELFS